MPYNPQVHHRRSIRLKGYDYTQPGAYFVTMVTQGRECLLGEVAGTEIRLLRSGTIAQRAWLDLPRHYPHVQLDEFCIMPNHLHGIVVLTNDRRGGSIQVKEGMSDSNQTRPYLPEIVRAFKSFSARRINALRHTPGIPVWQRNYYEHIVRDEAEWERIRAYIRDNPRRWAQDHENPLRAV